MQIFEKKKLLNQLAILVPLNSSSLNFQTIPFSKTKKGLPETGFEALNQFLQFQPTTHLPFILA
jgi:hypothetical protein